MQGRITAIAALASTIIVAAGAPDASGAIIQLTQDRALTANASAQLIGGGEPVADNKAETSAELGSFDRSLTSHAERIQPPPGFSAIADALSSQAVQVGPTSISGTIAADGRIRQSGGLPSAQVNSQWRTTFSVDKPTPFTLTGRLRMTAGPTTGSPVNYLLAFGFGRSDGTPNEPQFVYASGGQAGISGFGEDEPVSLSGTLEPGVVYTLSATVGGGMTAEGTVGADKRVEGVVTFTLTAVPEPSAAAALALAACLVLRRRRA